MANASNDPRSQIRRTTLLQDSFTRPANVTAYAAGDAISDDTTTPTALTFTGPARLPEYGGAIRAVTVHKSDQDLTNADFDLLLFDTSPAVAGFDDNAALAITDAEFANCVGRVAFTGSSDGVSVVTGDLYVKQNLYIPFVVGTTNALYGVLVARAAYTPASGEVFTVTLHIDQD